MTSASFFVTRNMNSKEAVKMFKNKTNQKMFALLSIALLLSLAILISSASALISQNSTSWFWISDTSITSVAFGDVNGDGQTEIVTAGYYNDGVRFNAQLTVWNAFTMVGQQVMNWYWTGDTQITSVALANITGGRGLDIITGGAFFDGARWNGQLAIWNGTTLAGEKVMNWYWTGDTMISSVAVANVSGGTGLDVIVGGAFFDGTRWNAQLTVWNASTLAGEKLANWYWTGDTMISSVAVANVSGGTGLEIVTGGDYFDGTRNVAQLIVWNGTTLVGERIVNWFITGDTQLSSVAVANVSGGTGLEIVTGGDYFDGTRNVAQLIVWNGTTLVGERLTNWFTISNTTSASVAIGNLTGGSNFDVITGGTYNDGLKNNAQLIVWNGATLAGTSMATWAGISNTELKAIADGNINGGGPTAVNRVVAGGDFYDNIRLNAQLSLWA